MSRLNSGFTSVTFFLAISLVALLCVSGQSNAPGSIRGKVVLANGGPLNETALIRLESLRGVRSTVYTDSQGQFNLLTVPVGIYEVVVEADRTRFELASTKVEVFPNAPSIVNIVVREKNPSARAKPDSPTVSAGELDPSVPAAAKKEFDRASASSKQGRSDEAIAALRRAIALYPHYLRAHNDLGVQLLGQGKLEEAADELREAIEIDPKAFNPHLNLGMVLVHQQKFSEAKEELAKALALEANSAAARLYMGLALVALEQPAEAETELKVAYDLGGTDYAIALFHLGQIYLNKGDRSSALKMFEKYLSLAPSAANADEVKKLISLIK